MKAKWDYNEKNTDAPMPKIEEIPVEEVKKPEAPQAEPEKPQEAQVPMEDAQEPRDELEERVALLEKRVEKMAGALEEWAEWWDGWTESDSRDGVAVEEGDAPKSEAASSELQASGIQPKKKARRLA